LTRKQVGTVLDLRMGDFDRSTLQTRYQNSISCMLHICYLM